MPREFNVKRAGGGNATAVVKNAPGKNNVNVTVTKGRSFNVKRAGGGNATVVVKNAPGKNNVNVTVTKGRSNNGPGPLVRVINFFSRSIVRTFAKS